MNEVKEQTAPLSSPRATNSYLIDKVLFGLSTLGGIAFGVSIASSTETDKPLALCTAALIGVSLLGLNRAFSSDQKPKSDLNSLVTKAELDSKSELSQISSKINKIIDSIPLDYRQLNFLDQQTTPSSNILNQISFIEAYCNSQNQNGSKIHHNATQFGLDKPSKDLSENSDLKKDFDKALTELRELKNKNEELESKNIEMQFLEIRLEFFKNHLKEAHNILGLPGDPILNDSVERARTLILSTIRSPNYSELSSTSNSAMNSAVHTPYGGTPTKVKGAVK